MKKAMTEGNIWKQLLAFTLPLLLGNLFQQTYNLADSAIVGQTLGANALAAVGSSSSVQFMVLGFCQGCAAGFAIPVASSFGAGNEKKMRQYVFLGAILTAVIALILTLTTCLLNTEIVHLLQTPAEIAEDAETYLFIIFLGIPCTLLYNYLSAILRAIGDSRTPFYFLAFSSILNIGLDFYCILSLHWGVAGAAIATIFSQGVSGILCLLLIRKKFRILVPSKEEKAFDQEMTKGLLNQGLPMGLQFSITAIGSMVMQTANNGLGTIYVSGFAAGVKIKQFTLCPFDALGAAISTFISQNRGACKPDRIRQGEHAAITIGVTYGILAGLILIFFGRDLCMLFVSAENAEVLDAGGRYLSSLGKFYWVLGFLITKRMSVQGLGWSRQAMIGGIIEMIARCAVSSIFVPLYGYTAICFTDQSAWISASIYLFFIWKNALHHAEMGMKQELAIQKH